MGSDRAFRIPRAQKDRVQPRQLVAIAATWLSVGIALSGVLATKPTKQREHDANEHENAWQRAAAGPALPTLADAQHVQRVIEAALGQEERATETSVSAATSTAVLGPEAVVATAKMPSKKAKSTLVRGAATYHCSGTHGCPHDRALEARAWRVLARLPSCRGSADALGNAVLKLWFEPSLPTRVVFAASTISPSLNLRAVSQCVAAGLSKLRATRNTDRFELSLSFGLAARN